MSEPKRYSPSIEWDEDTIQKESVMIECVGGSWIKYSDYARLKAEVEELTHDANEADQQYEHAISRVRRLEAEVERLRKAGDAMYEWICLQSADVGNELEDWDAAKEGKQP